MTVPLAAVVHLHLTNLMGNSGYAYVSRTAWLPQHDLQGSVPTTRRGLPHANSMKYMVSAGGCAFRGTGGTARCGWHSCRAPARQWRQRPQQQARRHGRGRSSRRGRGWQGAETRAAPRKQEPARRAEQPAPGGAAAGRAAGAQDVGFCALYKLLVSDTCLGARERRAPGAMAKLSGGHTWALQFRPLHMLLSRHAEQHTC